MPDLDPFFDGRFMHQGTSGAEFIYNEFAGRVAASGFRIKSRTTTVPPASPDTFDAYLVPPGGTAAWLGLDGNFVIWMDFWLPMAPKIGVHMYVIEENLWIDFTTAVPSQASAVDGQVNVPLVLETGSQRIKWDTGKGVTAYTLLTDNAIFMAPTNMKPGRKYMLRVQQDALGPWTLTLEANEFAGQGLANPLVIATAASTITDIYIQGPTTPINKPTIYLVEPTVALIA